MAKTAQDNSVNKVDQRNTQQEENEDTEKEEGGQILEKNIHLEENWDGQEVS